MGGFMERKRSLIFFVNCIPALFLISICFLSSCTQKGNSHYLSLQKAVTEGLVSNDLLPAFMELDSLNQINPSFNKQDTTISFLENKLNTYVTNMINKIHQSLDTINPVQLGNKVNHLNSIANRHYSTNIKPVGNVQIIAESSRKLTDSYLNNALYKMDSITKAFKTDPVKGNGYTDTTEIFHRITEDSLNLLKYKNAITFFKDNLRIMSADSVTLSYNALVPLNLKIVKNEMIRLAKDKKRMMLLYNGTWSKYESSGADAYAIAGISSQTTSTYTFKNDGTYLYRVKSIESTPTLRSNMTEDEKGTWSINMSDTSITLTCDGKRTLNSDLSVQAKYGTINNQGGDSEWESCSNTTDFTLAKLREDGYRKTR
jgi:hypothetical protein